MKKMKKLATGLAIGSILGMALAGCSSDDASNEENSGEKVILKYANWNLGTEADQNLERLMIDAYNKSQDEVKVEIDKSIDADDYGGKLNTAASAGKLPDVFMLNDIPTSYKNEWLLDISELVKADKEFSEIDETVAGTTKINDQHVAIPFAKHLMGYYVNMDLVDSMNLDPASSETSIQDFVKSVKEATDLGKGYVGTDNAQAMLEWYPGATNENFGWFTFEDGKFNLTSNEMIEAVNSVKDLATNGYAYNNLTPEQKADIAGDDSGVAFKSGHIAYYFNGTYMNADLQKTADFNFEFIGLPGGRNAIVNDYLGISKSTKYAQEAYDFAKYMSFGKDGFLKRMQLAEDEGLELATLPLTSNAEVNETYWSVVTVPGVEEANNNLENAMFDPIKVTPGYIQARFEAPTGLKIGEEENANTWYLLNEATLGNVNYQDYAEQLQELAQKSHDEAVASMK